MVVLGIGMVVEKGGMSELLWMHVKSLYFNIPVNPEHFTTTQLTYSKPHNVLL